MPIFPKLSINWTPKPKQQPDPQLIAAQELNEARLDRLRAQKELEYWASMVPMLDKRCVRLAKIAGGDDES